MAGNTLTRVGGGSRATVRNGGPGGRADGKEEGEASASTEIQAELPDDLALLSFMVTEKYLVAWVIKKDKIRAARIPLARKELAGKVARVRMLIEHFSPVDSELEKLYSDLIAPLADELDSVRVVGVLPHDVLNYLPFAALLILRLVSSDTGGLFSATSLIFRFVSSECVFPFMPL